MYKLKFIIYAVLMMLISSATYSNVSVLDSLNINNKIKVLSIHKSVYTGIPDTTVLFAGIYEDKMSRFNLLIFNPDSSFYQLYTEDSLFFYDREKETYKSREYDFKRYQELASDIYWLFYEKRLMYLDSSNFKKGYNIRIEEKCDSIGNKYLLGNLKSLNEDTELEVRIKVKEQKSDTLYFNFQFLESGETLDNLTSNRIFINDNHSPIFDSLDKFYLFERFYYFSDSSKSFKKSITKELYVGDELLIDFTFLGLNSKDINLNEYFKKNNYIAIYTWGTWCSPCISNRPNVVKFNNLFNSFTFITLAYEFGRASESEMNSYIKRNKLNFSVLFSDLFIESNNLKLFPALIVIDKFGVINDIYYGFQTDFTNYQSIINKYKNSD